ncbi:MAG: Gfo/Idh/MocA family protein [Gemmatimonadota bacterium]|jgi:predicted dehydrogenase|nr:Gfo/Idh/MocA family oxidoreductase [Gemmatimonadota bacterium]
MGQVTLRVGFIGSGFNTRFHLMAWRGVRQANVTGIWSPNFRRAADAARFAAELDVGQARAFRSITEMIESGSVDAIWLCGPNHARIENVEEIVSALARGRGTLKGLACEKPLARTVAEARQVKKLVDSVGLPTGYLENQLFAPHVEAGKALLWARGAATTGRPYLARAAEEHSGPHMPWFWQGRLQGGGVLNDMMCHSVLVVRHLLTHPDEPLSAVRPARVTGHIASLKWSRPEYVKELKKTMGPEVDYAKAPAEDFAAVNVEFEVPGGGMAIGEATTSWSFVGAGLRLSAECLGPEYSMRWNSLDSGLQLFFSRRVKGKSGEDLVEKQNAEQGVMPVVPEEYLAYGYTNEDRHFVRAFLGKEQPRLTFEHGLEVVQLLMTAYQSAEQGKTLAFPPKGLDKFVPKVAQGAWRP